MTGINSSTPSDLCGGFQGLADPIRLSILEYLKGHGETCVSDLCVVLNINQSKLSFHLATLKSARLISFRKHRQFNYYFINKEEIEKLKDYLGA